MKPTTTTKNGPIFNLLSDQQIINIIDRVASFHKNKVFLHFDSNDIEQQVRLTCWQKINGFDPSRRKNNNKIEQALENWLNRIVSNRLKNLYRDHVKIVQKDFKKDDEFSKQKRQNLLMPVSLSEGIDICGIDSNNIEFQELLGIIVDNIDHELFDILEALLSGEIIGDYYKKRLFQAITKVLQDVRDREYKD